MTRNGLNFAVYNNQKYMYCPVVTDKAEAAAVWRCWWRRWSSRYDELAANMVKNIAEYNERGGKMPYIVCVIDEFADLMQRTRAWGSQCSGWRKKPEPAGFI